MHCSPSPILAWAPGNLQLICENVHVFSRRVPRRFLHSFFCLKAFHEAPGRKTHGSAFTQAATDVTSPVCLPLQVHTRLDTWALLGDGKSGGVCCPPCRHSSLPEHCLSPGLSPDRTQVPLSSQALESYIGFGVSSRL